MLRWSPLTELCCWPAALEMEEAVAEGMEVSDEDENGMVYCSGACASMLLPNYVLRACIVKDRRHVTVTKPRVGVSLT